MQLYFISPWIVWKKKLYLNMLFLRGYTGYNKIVFNIIR